MIYKFKTKCVTRPDRSCWKWFSSGKSLHYISATTVCLECCEGQESSDLCSCAAIEENQSEFEQCCKFQH